MAESSPSTSLELSIIDQTMCRHYIRNVLCFPFTDPSAADAATRQLHAGLRATLQTWPYLAGQIRLVPGEGPSGHVEVRYSSRIPDLVASGIFEVRKHHDLHAASIHYDHMTAAGMPCSLLPTHLVCSLPDSPDLCHDDSDVWPPLLHVAVNFIPGGLLLAVYASHSIIDGVGLSHFLEVFAENVRSHPNQKERAPCLFDRSLITAEAHKAYEAKGIVPCPEFKFKNTCTALPKAIPSRPVSPPKIVGKIFRFNASVLHRLREALRDHLVSNIEPENAPKTISMWDTLAALLWVYQLRARFGADGDCSFSSRSKPKTSRFGYTINVRRRLDPPLPDSYIGNVVLYTYTEVELGNLLSPATPSSSNGVLEDGAVNGANSSPLLPPLETIPIHALATAALHIRAANSDFDTDAISARLAYLTQVPVPKLGSLVPNMVIAQDDPDYNSSVNSSGSDALLFHLQPENSTPPEKPLQHFGQQRTFNESPTSGGPPSAPPDIFATSWEDIGANADFGIVGTDPDDGRPQFVRKPKSVFNEGGTIILPRRRAAKSGSKPNGGGELGAGAAVLDTDDDSEQAPYEVLLQLPEEHMERLCWQSELGGWVERIVE